MDEIDYEETVILLQKGPESAAETISRQMLLKDAVRLVATAKEGEIKRLSSVIIRDGAVPMRTVAEIAAIYERPDFPNA